MTSTRAPGRIAPPTAWAALDTGSATARMPVGNERPVWNEAASSESAGPSTTCPRQSGARGSFPMAALASASAPAGTASAGIDAIARSSATSGWVASRSLAATTIGLRCAPT